MRLFKIQLKYMQPKILKIVRLMAHVVRVSLRVLEIVRAEQLLQITMVMCNC